MTADEREPDPAGWTGRDGTFGPGAHRPAPPRSADWSATGSTGWSAGYGATPAVPPYFGGPSWGPPPPARHTGWKVAACVAVVAAACSVGYGIGVLSTQSQTAATAPGGGTHRDGSSPFGSTQWPVFGLRGGSIGHTGTASAVQSTGIVDVDTQLGYEGEDGAGTGMVLSSDGFVLTNNHVVDGATSIDVTIVSTGRTYTASVVGTDPTKDVAVVKLVGVSGLATARFGTTTSVGAPVTGVGNAGGVGGTPTAAPGTVDAVNQKLTASDDGSDPEKLTGMIETTADIIPGDSGGPLYDSSDRIVGMDTAASGGSGATHRGFAIPIATARSVAAQIESGVRTAAIHLGYPGFLGIDVGRTTVAGGVPIASVMTGGAAARSGLVAGDDITSVGGRAVSTAAGLHTVLAADRPGQQVTVEYLTPAGTHRTVDVTLGTGPAD